MIDTPFGSGQTYSDVTRQLEIYLDGTRRIRCIAVDRCKTTTGEDHTIYIFGSEADASILMLMAWGALVAPEEREWRIAQDGKRIIVSRGAYTRVHILSAGSTMCGHYWPDRPASMRGDRWISYIDELLDVRVPERCTQCWERTHSNALLG